MPNTSPVSEGGTMIFHFSLETFLRVLFSKLHLSIVFLIFLMVSVQYAQEPDCHSIPDLIYYNGTIITMDPDNPLAEAIAIKADTILAVGTNEEIMDMLHPSCPSRLVNLNGLTMLPGFNDSHSHWFSWREHICTVSAETTYPELEEIMTMLSSNGWTSISELNFGRPDYAAEHLNNALDLDSRGELSTRLNGYWGTMDDAAFIDMLADSGRFPAAAYSDRIHAPGVKMYVDDPFGTTDILSQDEVDLMVQAAHNNGWQVAAHAVNQSAVEKILTAFETVLGDESNQNHRHRIEHAVKVSDDQLARMKQKGIVASIQLLGPPDWPEQTTFQTYISNTDSIWCLRWKDFMQAESEGLHVTGSTDAPFNEAPCDYSPFRIIYQAVSRTGYLDRTHADWELNQRLTVEESIKLMTINAAWATFEEDKKGSLEAGKWADLVVVSQNPFEIATPEDLLDIQILQTMVGGEIVYCNLILGANACNPAEIFRVDSVSIYASKYLPDQTPDKAYDDNPETNWGSGDDAPQWIEFDLGQEIVVGSIDLTIDQWPAGVTTHQILARDGAPGSSLDLIHEFNQNTEIGQVLTYTAPFEIPPYRHFRILTTQSPSWVSWKEVSFNEQTPASIDHKKTGFPNSFVLKQNYPNPFNPETVIEYRLPQREYVTLKIFNQVGQEIITLIDADKAAGVHRVRWNGQDQNKNQVASGTYIYQFIAGEYRDSKKFVLLR
jgi:predicted amidohydrolase YtcJ